MPRPRLRWTTTWISRWPAWSVKPISADGSDSTWSATQEVVPQHSRSSLAGRTECRASPFWSPLGRATGICSPAEVAVWRAYYRLESLPPDEFIRGFMRLNVKQGVELPPPPTGDPPPWMAKRPGGISAFMETFRTYDLDRDALARFDRPVYFALGGLSNPDQFGEIALRLAGVFPDFQLEVFEERHHFDPPHRIEPERLADSLRALWSRAGAGRPMGSNHPAFSLRWIAAGTCSSGGVRGEVEEGAQAHARAPSLCAEFSSPRRRCRKESRLTGEPSGTTRAPSGSHRSPRSR